MESLSAPVPIPRRRPGLPAGSLVLGAALWGCYWWPLRYFTQHGLGGPWLVFFAYLLLSIPGAGLLWWQHRDLSWRRHWRPLLALGLLGGWTNVAFMLALFQGSVLQVLLLFYLSPAWAFLFARWFLAEALGWRGILAVSLALSGCLLVITQHGHGVASNDDWFTWLLALSSGLAFALANVVLRGANHLPDLPRAVVIWWGCAVLALLFAVWTPFPVAPERQVLFLPIFAWLWIGGATASTVYGVSRLPVTVSSVIMPIEVFVGAITAWWLAGEAISGWEFVGGTLILSASMLQLLGQRAQAE